MVQQVTHNIKVSVDTHFEGAIITDIRKQYAFSYEIVIENNSNQKVQLLSRYWLIKDALNETEIVEGKGVIGRQPVLAPGEIHTYKSGCLLTAPFGSMQGHYIMTTPFAEIEVGIPLFKLSVPFAMN
ncbi:MAG: Co2+/Mg2+ efflux protein ApaG [Flavobacteriaceae bacterium]